MLGLSCQCCGEQKPEGIVMIEGFSQIFYCKECWENMEKQKKEQEANKGP